MLHCGLESRCPRYHHIFAVLLFCSILLTSPLMMVQKEPCTCHDDHENYNHTHPTAMPTIMATWTKCPSSNSSANGKQEALVDSGLLPTAQAGTLSNPKNTATPYAKKHDLGHTVATSVLGLFTGTLVRGGPNVGLCTSTGVPTSSLCLHSTLHSSSSHMRQLAGSEPVGLHGMYLLCEKPWLSAGLGGSW